MQLRRFMSTAMLTSLTALHVAGCQSGGSPFSGASQRELTFISAAQTWDLNKDNVVTCDEWKQYLATSFAEVDANKDGAITLEEFVAPRDTTFVRFDKSGDGVLPVILHGDAASEAFLSEIVGAQPWPGQRHMNMESIYEFGSRAGFWRLWRLFTERAMPVTVFAVATALARNPEAVAGMKEAGWEIATHGLKWIDYKDFAREDERAHILEAIRIHTEVTGERPLGRQAHDLE